MANALESRRRLMAAPNDAVLEACVIEATAPKAGNVFPGRSFEGLTYQHFLTAASIADNAFAQSELPVTERALAACRETSDALQTNVNLGIVLLLTPLVAADESGPIREQCDWIDSIAKVIEGFSQADSENLLSAIRAANPSGMSEVTEMDIQSVNAESFDIREAMNLAVDRDRIARQYSTGFRDLIDNIVPVLKEEIDCADNLLVGVARAHLRLLASEPDTLIARKCGYEVAKEVQQLASQLDLDDEAACQAFDTHLRSDGNRLNPGTTADLIAAGLYVLLRTPN